MKKGEGFRMKVQLQVAPMACSKTRFQGGGVGNGPETPGGGVGNNPLLSMYQVPPIHPDAFRLAGKPPALGIPPLDPQQSPSTLDGHRESPEVNPYAAAVDAARQAFRFGPTETQRTSGDVPPVDHNKKLIL
jgi:hypothetical protein